MDVSLLILGAEKILTSEKQEKSTTKTENRVGMHYIQE